MEKKGKRRRFGRLCRLSRFSRNSPQRHRDDRFNHENTKARNNRELAADRHRQKILGHGSRTAGHTDSHGFKTESAKDTKDHEEDTDVKIAQEVNGEPTKKKTSSLIFFFVGPPWSRSIGTPPRFMRGRLLNDPLLLLLYPLSCSSNHTDRIQASSRQPI
jgi:hypothetical protein